MVFLLKVLYLFDPTIRHLPLPSADFASLYTTSTDFPIYVCNYYSGHWRFAA